MCLRMRGIAGDTAAVKCMDNKGIIEALIVAILAAIGWIVQRLWATKPSYKELDLALEKAMTAFRATDIEADMLRIKPIELSVELLKAQVQQMHVENKQELQELAKDIKRLIAVVGNRFASENLP